MKQAYCVDVIPVVLALVAVPDPVAGQGADLGAGATPGAGPGASPAASPGASLAASPWIREASLDQSPPAEVVLGQGQWINRVSQWIEILC